MVCMYLCFLASPSLLSLITYIIYPQHTLRSFDARGFVLGPPLALAMNRPFFMLRKQGKMPNVICGEKYSKVNLRCVGQRGFPCFALLFYVWMYLGACLCGGVVTIPITTPPHMTPSLTKTPKPLPFQTKPKEYEGDHAGGDTLCISRTAVSPGERVLLIDDLIATGGTLLAGVELVKRQQVGGWVGGGWDWGVRGCSTPGCCVCVWVRAPFASRRTYNHNRAWWWRRPA